MFYMKIPKWVSPLEALTHPNLIQPDSKITYGTLLDEEGKLKSEESLKLQNILQSWWPLLQIRTRYKQDQKEYGFEKQETIMDKALLSTKDKQIKTLYRLLLDWDLKEEEVKDTMIEWAKNFGHTISMEQWERVWTFSYKITVATAYKENLLKMFHRWHLTPARLAKMSPNISNLCWKCKEKIGTYFHCWWTCDKAKKYWIRIHKWLNQILRIELAFKPELFLLGILPENISKEKKYLILHITTAARLTWAQNWKLEEAPTEEMAINKILECAEMDRLTYRLKQKESSKLSEVWNLFYTWLKERKKGN